MGLTGLMGGRWRAVPLVPIATDMRAGPLLVVLASAAIAVGCASSGAVPRPFPGTARSPVPGPAAGSPDGEAVVGSALALRGTPYQNGGSGPAGFDCSGFVQYVFARHGIALPREVREQFQAGRPVKADQIRTGDLLFFATNGHGASHVGIAIGADQFIHAPSAKGVVRVERYSARYWATRYLGARRLTR